MTSAANNTLIETPSTDLLKDPLLWFFAEHHKHRQICQKLTEHAGSVVLDAGLVKEILIFLQDEMPLHIIDEEDDLFPLLRRRCEPEDRLERTLGQLSGEHAADLDIGKNVIRVLENALESGRGLGTSRESKAVIEEFCRAQRNHIALENAVVLPIARARLTKEDQKSLGKRLAARRGLTDPFKKTS
ncbi:hemerythrin domain-containing protein [Robiginitomaculum antarcticum]|uniref:hemerythrin domain-containing protein n=1 Tax=Robiginitomaculum antarcticum TaxID=437507 RepID=UPI0012EA61B2|nr:hemerythrin domain-containing protein [Robiginitomaculum antarcticum]